MSTSISVQVCAKPAVPVVVADHEKPWTSSKAIAQHFGKRHADVLRAIKNLDCSGEFGQRNFALSEELSEQGKALPVYRVSKDGFMWLAMGFTGARAAEVKELYIKAFNDMEQALRRLDQEASAKLERELLMTQRRLIMTQRRLITAQRREIRQLRPTLTRKHHTSPAQGQLPL